MTAADIYSEIAAIVAAADDPDALRNDVLRRVKVDDGWRPGEAPPDPSLDARWRRALAANPDAVLGTLQRTHPEPSVKQFGNGREWEITLADGAGQVLLKFIPGK